MRPRPDGIFVRVALLLGAVLLATLAVSFWSLRALSLQPGSEQIADLLAGQIVAQRALAARPLPPAPPSVPDALPIALDVRRQAQPPPDAQPPRLPFLRQIERRLQQRLGAGTRMRIQEGAESRLWVAPPQQGEWIGVAVPPFAAQATRLTLVVIAAALIAIGLGATVFARTLVRPIEALARRAGALLDGRTDAVPALAQAPHEVRVLAQALQQAGQARQDAERQRALLLAGLSHDLRTPLARLRLALELDPHDVTLRAGMQQDIGELDAILSQFIDYARGAGDEPRRDADLVLLLHDCVARERLDPAHWSLGGLDGECMWPLRPLALRRAVANLLRNAQRHGAPPFELELRCAAESVCIAVSDRGTGADAAQLERLVQPFVRGDTARGGGGSGLGLAVAEQVARSHGGDLRLAQREGGGLVAELRLGRVD